MDNHALITLNKERDQINSLIISNYSKLEELGISSNEQAERRRRVELSFLLEKQWKDIIRAILVVMDGSISNEELDAIENAG